MQRSSRPSRHKHGLEPISIDEALSDSALTGMLSFLERAPTGDPLPWVTRNTGMLEVAVTESTPTAEESSTVEELSIPAPDSSTVTFIPTVEDSSAVDESVLQFVVTPEDSTVEGSSAVGRSSTVGTSAAEKDPSAVMPPVTVGGPSTVEDSSTVEDPSTHPEVSPTKPIKARLMRATLVQHGHTPAEHMLYTTLWTNGKPDAHMPNTRLARIGYRELTRLCNFSKRTLTSLIPVLVEKLAIEIVDGGDYDHTSRCYRVWDMKALLARREAAGMKWVLRNKGVRFVTGPPDLTLTSLSGGDASTVEASPPEGRIDSGRSYYSTVEEPTPVTIEDPSTQLRKGRIVSRKTTTAVPEALSKGLRQILSFFVDDEAIRVLWKRCRDHASDCTSEEIIHFTRSKVGILQNSKVQNPVGFLLVIVPKCFEGSSFIEYRQEQTRLQQLEKQRTKETEEQITQIRSEFEAMLLDPDSSEEDRRFAQRMLDQLAVG